MIWGTWRRGAHWFTRRGIGPRFKLAAEFEKRVTLSVFLEAAEQQALYVAARTEGISASRLARKLIVAGLERPRTRQRKDK